MCQYFASLLWDLFLTLSLFCFRESCICQAPWPSGFWDGQSNWRMRSRQESLLLPLACSFKRCLRSACFSPETPAPTSQPFSLWPELLLAITTIGPAPTRWPSLLGLSYTNSSQVPSNPEGGHHFLQLVIFLLPLHPHWDSPLSRHPCNKSLV